MDKLTLMSMLAQLWEHDGVQVRCTDDQTGTKAGYNVPREFCCPACVLRWVDVNRGYCDTVLEVQSIKHRPRVPGGGACWLDERCTKSTSSR